MSIFWEQKGNCVEVRVLVQPNASRDRIVGMHGDRLKISLHALPVEGEANDALIRFLSDLMDIPKRSIEIISGHSQRRKTVSLLGVSSSVFLQKIRQS